MRSEGSIRNTTRLIAKRAAVAFAASALASCGSVQRSYWDAKVEEMCRKDGGVTVYERIKLTPGDLQRLKVAGDMVVVPPKRIGEPEGSYVMEDKTTEIHRDPPVLRIETSIVRTSDRKVVSRSVMYLRSGEALYRSFDCRDVGVKVDLERQTFDVSGVQKWIDRYYQKEQLAQAAYTTFSEKQTGSAANRAALQAQGMSPKQAQKIQSSRWE